MCKVESPAAPAAPAVESVIGVGGVDMEQVLKELGEFRLFHLKNYFLLAIAIFTTAIYATNFVFTAADVDYRCVVPECETSNSTEFRPPWTGFALPAKESYEARCSRRVPLDGTCTNGSFGEELQACQSWRYETNYTIVTEFELACQEWKRTLVGTISNLGMLVSLPIIGYISDRWGRKIALVLSATLVGVVGVLKAFSINYEMYVIVQFLETVAGASVFPAAYITTIELLREDRRVLATAFVGVMLVSGGISLSLLAKAIKYWRTFILAVYTPSILFVSYTYFLPESIRWLLSNGEKDKAKKIILQAAKTNNVTLSEETMRQLNQAVPKMNVEKNRIEDKGIWQQVLKSPIIMRRLLICSWWWITCTFVFYGLAINSVSLAGDKYVNYILVVSVEIIGVISNALVLDRIGRKKTLLIAYTMCGILCIAIPFIPKSMPWLAMLMYLGGKVAITQAFSGIYMYTSELFPTNARHSLLGTCSMVGRLGSIVAPQMPLLAIYVSWLPLVLFGCAALIAGCLMMTTPETLHTRLPDTIAEAEHITRNRCVPSQDIQMNQTNTTPL